MASKKFRLKIDPFTRVILGWEVSRKTNTSRINRSAFQEICKAHFRKLDRHLCDLPCKQSEGSRESITLSELEELLNG